MAVAHIKWCGVGGVCVCEGGGGGRGGGGGLNCSPGVAGYSYWSTGGVGGALSPGISPSAGGVRTACYCLPATASCCLPAPALTRRTSCRSSTAGPCPPLLRPATLFLLRPCCAPAPHRRTVRASCRASTPSPCPPAMSCYCFPATACLFLRLPCTGGLGELPGRHHLRLPVPPGCAVTRGHRPRGWAGPGTHAQGHAEQKLGGLQPQAVREVGAWGSTPP